MRNLIKWWFPDWFDHSVLEAKKWVQEQFKVDYPDFYIDEIRLRLKYSERMIFWVYYGHPEIIYRPSPIKVYLADPVKCCSHELVGDQARPFAPRGRK